MKKTIILDEALHFKGTPVTAPFISSTGKGVVIANDYSMLKTSKHDTTNMIHQFHPLDFTVNGVAKISLTAKCEEWYSKEIAHQINAGVEVVSVKIKTILFFLKSVHVR